MHWAPGPRGKGKPLPILSGILFPFNSNRTGKKNVSNFNIIHEGVLIYTLK